MYVLAQDIYALFLQCWGDVLDDGPTMNESLVRLCSVCTQRCSPRWGDEHGLILIQSNANLGVAGR